MGVPDISLTQVLPRVGEISSANDRGYADLAVAELPLPFQLNDRVERLTGESERSSWGTIIGEVNAVEAGTEWLVRDNDGVTHRDQSADILRAVRGRKRNRAPRPV